MEKRELSAYCAKTIGLRTHRENLQIASNSKVQGMLIWYLRRCLFRSPCLVQWFTLPYLPHVC